MSTQPTGDRTVDRQGIVRQPNLQAGNECIVLRPGDTATAEVVVRQRRIIDFILDPFKKLQKGGLDL